LEEFINNCFPTFEDVATRAFQDEEEIGWLCIELIRVAGLPTGEPQRLEHIPSHTIRIHKDGNRFMQTWDGFNNRWFKLIGDYRSVEDREDKDIDKKDGSEHPLNSLDKNNVAHEMIYDINYSSRSSYYGTPDSVPAIRTMIGDQSAVNYNISFFKNFAIPAYAIYITGYFEDEPELDDDDEPTGKTVLQVAMEEKFQSVVENPHGSLVFMIPTADPSTRVEIRFEKLTVDTKESSFRLYRMDNSDEVISAHRVDPYRAMVMQTGSLGGNTAIESKKNYKSTTIKPKQRRFEALININVIWEESPKGLGITDYAIQLEELDTEDEAHEMAMDQALFMMGAIRPIDIIKKWEHKTGIPVPENLDKDPALNAYYINNVPVTSSEKGEQPPQTTAMPEEVAKILDDIANKIEEQNGYS
jgi:PBSX family phage portal protein